MKKYILTILVATLVFVVTGCSKIDTTKTSGQTSIPTGNPSVNSSEKPVRALDLDYDRLFLNPEIKEYAKDMIGKKASNFNLTNIGGEKIELDKLKGKNVVFKVALTGCSACIESYLPFEEFAKNNPKVATMTIFPNETKESIETFLTKNNFKYNSKLIAGEKKISIIPDYKITATPTFIFIDANGFIAYIHVGSIDEPMLQSLADLAFGN